MTIRFTPARRAASTTARVPSTCTLWNVWSPISLALSVGDFLSTVCPEQIVLREVRKRGRGRTPTPSEA